MNGAGQDADAVVVGVVDRDGYGQLVCVDAAQLTGSDDVTVVAVEGGCVLVIADLSEDDDEALEALFASHRWLTRPSA